MADPNNPVNPNDQQTAQAQQPQQSQNNIDVKSLENLERFRDLQSKVNAILMDYNVTAKDAVQKTEELKQKYISENEAINKLLNSSSKLNTEYSLFSENLKTQIEHTGKLADTLEMKLKKTVQDNITLEEEYKKITGEKIDQITLEEDKLKKVKDVLTEQNKAYAEMSAAEKQQAIDKLKWLGIAKDDIEARKILIQVEHQRNKQLQESIPSQLNENNLLKIKGEKLGAVSSAAGGLVDKLSGVNAGNNMVASSMIALGGGADKLAKGLASGFLDSFLKPENAMNRFFNFLNKNLIQSTFEFDKILSEVNKNTGGFRKEFEQIGLNKAGPFAASAAGELATYGVGLKELGAAYTALANKVNGFNHMTEQQRTVLTKNAATMETLGVSAANYAELTSKFMGTLGKTAEGTRVAIDTLARDAIAAGRNVGEYAKEFESLMPKIVGYGREATQIFKELNAFAGMTKGVMSTGDLQAFADQFNNWDSAAESVSKLNAVLGGTSLNIEELMKADPTEKLMMLKRSFDESGQDFDKLNIGYKRLLAEAFGGDVAKAGAFLKGNLAEANAEMQKMAATEKELEERKKMSVAAQEKLSKAIDTMKIALTPIIDIFAKVAESLAWISEKTNGFGTFLLVGVPLAVAAVRGAFKLWGMDVTSTFGSVFTKIRSMISGVRSDIAAAKTEAATIPPVGGGGSGGGGSGSAGVDIGDAADGIGDKLAKKGGKLGKLGKMLPGIGKFVGLAAMAVGAYNMVDSVKQQTELSRKQQDEQINEHDDGEENIGPGNKKFIYEGNTPIASFNKDDYVSVKGAKNPSNITGVNTETNTKLIEAIKDTTRVSTSAMVATREHAKELSQAATEVKKTSSEVEREKTKELVKETVTATAQNITVKSEVQLSGELGLSGTAVDRLVDRANLSSNSKVG